MKSSLRNKNDAKTVEQASLVYNQIVPGRSFNLDFDALKKYRQAHEETTTAANDEMLDLKFNAFIKLQKKLAYEHSQQQKAIKNLQVALNERKMAKNTKDPKLWTITKTLAEVALHFAIQNLKTGHPDKAVDYLFTAQHSSEPLPETDWQSMPEWQQLRRDIFKNVALYHQRLHDLPKALDNLRQAIFFEKALGDNSANSLMSAAVFLQQLGRFGEAIDFGN